MLNATFRLVPVVVALCASSTTASAQKLWIIDSNSGAGFDYTDFPTIAPPIASGDGLLVRNGTYNNDLLIDGYGLTVFAENGAVVSITGTVTVQNVGAGDTVVIEGLHSQQSSPTGHLIQNNSGSVWIEDCTLEAQTDGVTVTNSDHVVVNRCTIFGGADGLSVDSPRVTIWETSATALDQTATGAHGGAGLAIGPSGDVLAAGCAFAGGDGGPGGPGCLPPGLGGNGVTTSSGAAFEYWDVGLSAGIGGAYQPGCTGAPIDGKLKVGPGTEHPFSSLWIEDVGPATFGSSMQFNVDGVVGTGFDTFVWFQTCHKLTTLPVVGRILVCELGAGPNGNVPATFYYPVSASAAGSAEVVVAFVQPGYFDSGLFPTGGPTAAIFHKP